MIENPYLIQETLVEHSGFVRAVERIEQGFKYAKGSANPICIALIGESRTGKSRVLDECLMHHPRTRTEDGLNVPILKVRTPSKPTVKGLVELLLESIGDPKCCTGTENIKTSRLKKLMKDCGTQMVMIDEFQHFWDKGSRKVMHHVADWLKILVDDTNVALVVGGLHSCQAVLEQNEQLMGRFSAPIKMQRFEWLNNDLRTDFIAILGAYNESMQEHYDLPCLTNESMAFRFYCATGGLFGYLVKLLQCAVWNAIDQKTSVITLEDLAVAHLESTFNKEFVSAEIAPFHPDFNVQPTISILQKVSQIGSANGGMSIAGSGARKIKTSA